jgi:hypothetical protein
MEFATQLPYSPSQRSASAHHHHVGEIGHTTTSARHYHLGKAK